MAIVNPSDIVRATAEFSYETAGQVLVNVLHFQALTQSSTDDDEITDDLGVVMQQAYADLQANQSIILKYTQLTFQNLTQDIKLGRGPWPSFTQGSDAGQITSPQVAALLLMQTVKPRVQGRLYVPGIPEADVVNGILDAGWVTALLDTAATLLADIVVTFAVYKYVVYNVEFGTFNVPFGAGAVNPTRTQRRRSGGIGT